ncbi:MAG: FAD:protein FMN transferase [Streptococcaceae bacterium]|jgi:thiamine biosynthesis lipoprotein|nr:FAD:protein FMN transferase [Streptococcaceae bacterium]
MKFKKLTKFLALSALTVFAVGVLSACKTTASTSDTLLSDSDKIVVEKDTMGTTVTVTSYTPGTKTAAENALKIAENYNTWTTVSQTGSLVDAINAAAGTGKPTKVSDEIFTLINNAYNLSDQGTGYDVTVGPLTQLWHIGFPDAKLPTQSEINAVLPLINYKFMQLDSKNHTVYLTKKGAQLDLGSIVKGYVARLMTTYLKAHGMKNGIIDLGSSSLYIMGHSPRGANTKWNVGIKDPNNPNGDNLGIVTAENQFISTSGIYERTLKVGNTTYSHILNPKTGFPFDNDIQSVTIVGSDNPTFGDGVTTTIFALGTKKGYDYVMKHGYQAIFVDKNNKVYVTPGMKSIFTLNSKGNYKIADISTLKGNG